MYQRSSSPLRNVQIASRWLRIGAVVLAVVMAATLAWGVATTVRSGAGVSLMAVNSDLVVEPVQPGHMIRLVPHEEESTVVDPVAEPLAVEVAAAPAIVEAEAVEDEQPMFNGRPIRKVKQIKMLVTAYSPDERSCGKWADGQTASGYSVWTNGMKLVAADTKLLPFGSIITVPGYNNEEPVPVLDRGGAIKGKRLDVLYPTHEIALQWGAQNLNVDVWEYAD